MWEPDGNNAGSYVLKTRLDLSASSSDSEASDSVIRSRVLGVVTSESGRFVAAYNSNRDLYSWKEEKLSSESVGRLTLMDSESRSVCRNYPQFMFVSSDESSLYFLCSALLIFSGRSSRNNRH